MSGLYFRGKLSYASTFARPRDGGTGVLVIVPGLGLLAPQHVIDLAGLRAIAQVPVDPENPQYTGPLRRDAEQLVEGLQQEDVTVLLGSIATPKYLEPLTDILGSRLHYPQEFIGRGDMSRGSLMLRCAAEGRELSYVAVAHATTERGGP